MTDDLSRVLADIDSLLPPGAPSTSDEPDMPDAMSWAPVDHADHPDTAPPDRYVRRYADMPPEFSGSWSMAHIGTPVVADYWASNADGVVDDPADFDRHFPSLIPAQYRRQQPDPEHEGGMVEHFHPQPSATPPRYFGAGQRWMAAANPVWPAVWWIGPALGATEYAAALDNLTREAQRTTTNLQHLRDRHQQAQAVIEARRNRNTGPNKPRGADGRARRHQHPRKAAARNASPATQGNATPATRGWLDLIGEPEPWPATVIARRGDGSVVLGFDPAWQ